MNLKNIIILTSAYTMSGFHRGDALIIKGIPNMVTNRIHKEDVRS